MKMRKIIGAVLAASVLATALPTAASAHRYYAKKPVFHNAHSGGATIPWLVISCAGGIVFFAILANMRDNRQLTAQEAWTCGLLFLASRPRYVP